ncbi:MAG: tetratricopeptide repeat protein [Acidobacteria bacterium]|nr:tetratricopeptide repeat protein [Acidobacteriota bacterium]
MRKTLAAVLVLGFATTPTWSQSPLEKAIEKANKKVDEEKPDDAVKELTTAAKDVGAPGYVALGELNERLGRLDAAAAAYQQAVDVATPAYRPLSLARQSTFTLRKGTGREALRIANMAVEAGANATTLAARARAQARSEDGRGALESADKAVGLDASNAMAQLARGEALFALGQNHDAEVALRKAVQLAPSSPLAHSRLARVLMALARPAEAVPVGRKATELDANFGEGFAILGLALIAEDLNNWGEAIGEAQQGAFLDPDNPIVQTAVGRIFEANGRADLAVAAYRHALDADPGFAPARLALVKAELARGNRDAAIEEANKATPGTTSPETQILLAEGAIRDKEYEAALGYLESALEGTPGSADAWALLGHAYQNTGRGDDAAKAYARAVELAPQNYKYRTTYGLLLGMTGDLDGGLEQLRRVVDTPGYEDADAWVNLGWIHRNRSEAQESIIAYSRALEIDPDQAQAYLGLGWAHLQKEAPDEAIAAYEKAVALDPALAGAAYAGITWSYVFKGNAVKAREFLEKAQASGGSSRQLEEYVVEVEEGIQRQQEQRARILDEQRKANDRAQKLTAALGATRSQDPGRRALGARDLARHGGADPDVVDALTYLVQMDDSYDVRIAAAVALGSLGPGAQKAVPNIRGILAQEPYTAPLENPTQAEMDMEMKDYDYRKALREALKRIER